MVLQTFAAIAQRGQAAGGLAFGAAPGGGAVGKIAAGGGAAAAAGGGEVGGVVAGGGGEAAVDESANGPKLVVRLEGVPAIAKLIDGLFVLQEVRALLI
jgi:hypothetical protein